MSFLAATPSTDAKKTGRIAVTLPETERARPWFLQVNKSASVSR
jgi:hypothetical protein